MFEKPKNGWVTFESGKFRGQCSYINSFKRYNWKNQTKVNEKAWRKDLSKELELFYTQTKENAIIF